MRIKPSVTVYLILYHDIYDVANTESIKTIKRYYVRKVGGKDEHLFPCAEMTLLSHRLQVRLYCNTLHYLGLTSVQAD